MNPPAQPTFGDTAAFAAPRAPSVFLSRLRRAVVTPVKLIWGLLFCQSIVGSIVVIGWTYRLAQRSVLKYWWSRSAVAAKPNDQPSTALLPETPSNGQSNPSAPRADRTFRDFLDRNEDTRVHRHWPNWFVNQDFLKTLRRSPGVGVPSHIGSVLKALVSSLCLNFWIGLQAAFNTLLLTFPACVLWTFGWYDGWNNSFNKGYEQAAVGPLISFIGIFWFIAALFLLPLAQARQALTGEWRSFYQFRLVWKIARLRWLSCLGLALLYSLFSIPLAILKTGPMFWAQAHPEIAGFTDAQLLKALNDYFFRCALVLLPAYVVLRLVAARIYASGILGLLQTGKVEASALAPREREILQHLDLMAVRPQPQRHFLVRFIAWTGTRLGRTVGVVALVLIWFSFVAQIYIAEFFNHHGALGWLNQPLVQLPWFHYLPARLKNPIGDLFSALFVVLFALLIRRAIRAFRKTERPWRIHI